MTGGENVPEVLILGDSIAAGTGLNLNEDKYSSLFLNNTNMNGLNLAKSGYDSTDLLNQLGRIKTDKYQVLLLSIGANNILHSLTSRSTSIGLIIGNAYLSSNDEDFASSISNLQDLFESEDIIAEFHEGIHQFEQELPLILNAIYETNKDAEVYIQTIYNPFKGFKHTYEDEVVMDLETIADYYISQLNQIIENAVNTQNQVLNRNCILVDIYDAFKSSDVDYVNANFSRLYKDFEFDPHPNKEGHQKIADAIFYRWKEYHGLLAK